MRGAHRMLTTAVVAVLALVAVTAGLVLVAGSPRDRTGGVAPITLVPAGSSPRTGPQSDPEPPQMRGPVSGDRMTGGARPVEPLPPAPAAGPSRDDAGSTGDGDAHDGDGGDDADDDGGED